MTKPYHHGDLAQALLRAAEDLLEQEGPQALTLRAVARRTGVSHMAPAHHFGDLGGLLSELAAHGYRQFADRLARAQDNPGHRSISRATAQAYVGFAREKPGLFLLMFRSERLDFARPALAEAARAASAAQMRSMGAHEAARPAGDTRAALSRAVFQWSVVHGFAMLLIDGRLDGVMALPGSERDAATLLDEALESAFDAKT